MERKGHVAVALLMAASGSAVGPGFPVRPDHGIAVLAQIGVSAVPPMFWPLRQAS